MGVLGKIGHGLKKVGGAVGDVAKKAAPLATLIPGVGPVAAGIIGVGGGLLGKLNDQNVTLGGTLKDAAMGGAMGYGGAKLIDHFAPGMAGAGSGIPGVSRSGAAPVPGGPTDMRPDKPGNFANMGADAGSPDWLKMVAKYAPLALGAAGAFQNAQNASQGRELTAEQIQQARDAIARQKLLQDRALMPINVTAPDYSNIFGQTQNPFYKPAGA